MSFLASSNFIGISELYTFFTELLAAHTGTSLLPTLVGAVREFEGGLAAFDDLAAIHLRFEAPDRPR